MLRLLRLCLFVLVAVCAAPLALAQTTIYTPTEYTYPSLLGTDGNLYGDDLGGMFEVSLAPDVYSAINPSLISVTFCSIAPNGSFLGVTTTSVLYVTMQGTVTTLATLPYPSICPVLANDGNYYGGNDTGGAYGDGYLYQLTPAGKVSILYSFTGGTDGDGPTTPMLQASDGNLYGVGTISGEMFRFSAADGLTAYSSIAGISGPLYETSSGILNAIQGANLARITLQESITSAPLDLNNDPNATNSNGKLFFGGGGYLYLEEYYNYSNFNPYGCGEGNYMYLYSVAADGAETQPMFYLGSDETGYEESDVYTLSEFLAGNGSFYGGYVDNSTYYDEGDGFCDNASTYYAVYAQPAVSVAPITVTASANRIVPGGSTTVTWNDTNAFADSLQQCYGYNGLTGKLATSGTQKLTYSQAGTYTPAVVCGGTQTGVATVVVGGTTLALVASPASVTVGQPVKLTATLGNPGTPAPTGSVQFLYAGKVLATSSMNSSGVATLTASTAGLATGSYPITAKYLGNSNYSAATSSAVTVTVQPLATTTTKLTTSTPALVGGQMASFTVDVSSGGLSPYPTGTVTLYLGSQALLSGKLTADNPSTVSLSASTAGIAPGSYPITAKYSGDAYNLPSTSTAVTVTVQKGVTITVSASPNPVPVGDAFTLTAKVSGNSSTPTGTVIFSAGSQELSGANLVNGVATANIPANTLTAGTYSITAAYAGDSKNPSGTSQAYSLTVQ